jgi:hypothetical protein
MVINRRNPAFRWNGFYLKVLNQNSGYLAKITQMHCVNILAIGPLVTIFSLQMRIVGIFFSIVYTPTLV